MLTVPQLTATAISSPFFHPRSQTFEYAKVLAFETTFRHAILLLVQQRSKKDRTNHLNLSRWTGDVIEGIQGGHPILRLAACGGILLGVQDLKNNPDVNENGNGKASIKFSQMLLESETVLALAEVLDATTVHTEWEHEFQHPGQPQSLSQQHPTQDTLLLAFILASHSLPLIDSQRLTALPLYTLARLLTSALVSLFDLPDSNSESKQNPNTVTDLAHVPSLARLTSVILTALLDSTHTRTSARTLSTISDTFNSLLDLSKIIEQTDLSSQIPKQFLFTTLIISQSVLSSIVYLPPQPHDTLISPSSLALITLQTLTHLSLVISQFGGITKAFEQLQKVFYLSVDFLLAPSRQQNQNRNGKRKREENVEAYVQHLSHFLQTQSPEIVTTLPFRAKLSFALSAFEQLVPILSPRCIIDHVWDVCYPYLTNLSETNLEIYESAHSVVLSILVHDSQQRQELNSGSVLNSSDSEEEKLWTRFIQGLVPFYSRCLVQDTVLTIPQLRLAYSSLVQSATVLSTHPGPTTPPGTTTTSALPWYCVQLILDTIDTLSSASWSESLPTPSPSPLSRKDRVHRLRLMLLSTLPSLSVEMLERCLDRVRGVLIGYSKEVVDVEREETEKDEERKQELVQTLFEGLLSEQIGGEAKEVGVKWWYENLGLVREVFGRQGGEKDKEQKAMLQSRL